MLRRVTVIRPASRLPRLDVGELWHYRELLWTLVWRDVSVRYKQTFLGVAWAILVPAFTALVYVIVFGKFANFPAGDDPVSQPRRRRCAADAVLRVRPQPGEPEPAVEPAARHEGVLPADAAPARRRVACRSSTSSSACPCCFFLIWKYDTWPSGLGDLDRAALHPARGGDGARHQPAACRRQRPLPRRPLHDPRVPSGPAAPLGRDVRRRPDPREVAVDPLVQPDDLRDLRVALGRARRERSPTWARSPSASPSRSCSSSSGSPSFRSSEPRFADTI